MAKLLCATSGFPSVLYPSVELARRLLAAGHQVTFAGLAGARAVAESNGLAFIELEPSRYEHFLEEDAARGVLARLGSLQRRRERAAESTAVRGFIRSLRELEPDLLLIDGEMHEHIVAASAVPVSIAVLNTFASIWKRPGLPPPHVLVRPGVGWRGSRAGIELSWRAFRLRKWLRARVQWWRRLGCDRLSVIRRLAREAELDLREETDAGQWLVPFTYRRLPVLSLHARELELPHRPPARVRYVGPMVLESRLDREMTAEDRAALEAIFERRRGDDARRLVFAGFGTVFSTDLDFVRRLVDGVAQRPGWELVISLAGRDATPLGALPEPVHVFPWVPQLRVLRHADVAVTHGGINTIDECVMHRVPMLVYCGFQTDMAGNTARVVHHDIGIAGDRRRDSAAAIGAHLDRLMREPRFTSNLESMRRRFAAYAEDGDAERAVAEILSEQSA